METEIYIQPMELATPAVTNVPYGHTEQGSQPRAGDGGSHQSTMPSATALKRVSLLGSMGSTCLQSVSCSRAVFIQFTNANLSSSGVGGRKDQNKVMPGDSRPCGGTPQSLFQANQNPRLRSSSTPEGFHGFTDRHRYL